MAVQELNRAPSIPFRNSRTPHPLAKPGFGKRTVPCETPPRPERFDHLPERERIVASYIDRVPDQSDLAIKTMAGLSPQYGQQAMAACLRNLETAGHLRRVRRRVDTPRPLWVQHTFWCRQARGDGWWKSFLEQEFGSEAHRGARVRRVAPDIPAPPDEAPAATARPAAALGAGTGEVARTTGPAPEPAADGLGDDAGPQRERPRDGSPADRRPGAAPWALPSPATVPAARSADTVPASPRPAAAAPTAGAVREARAPGVNARTAPGDLPRPYEQLVPAPVLVVRRAPAFRPFTVTGTAPVGPARPVAAPRTAVASVPRPGAPAPAVAPFVLTTAARGFARLTGAAVPEPVTTGRVAAGESLTGRALLTDRQEPCRETEPGSAIGGVPSVRPEDSTRPVANALADVLARLETAPGAREFVVPAAPAAPCPEEIGDHLSRLRDDAHRILAHLAHVDPRLSLSSAECGELCELGAEWLARGTTPQQMTHVLSRCLPATIPFPGGFLRRRLTDHMPPDRRITGPGGTASHPAAEEAARAQSRLVECAGCGTPTRGYHLIADRCPVCRGVAQPRRVPPPRDPDVAREGAARARAAMRETKWRMKAAEPAAESGTGARADRSSPPDRAV